MEDFRAKSLCILGRQSQLGLAELEALYGASHLRKLNGAALLDVPTSEIRFKRLGGALKLAQILTVLPTTNWQEILQFLVENIPTHLEHQPAGKFTLGLSIYGLPVSLNDQTKGLMSIKRVIKSTGKSVRVIPNKTAVLNSAQVLHNKLTTKGAWELLLVRDGPKTILAQTIFVQDIEAYAARDQARPARDARIGMLPPKLAQIMINFAHPPDMGTVLDPFCGSGVILQEALLMGFKVTGSDINPKMVEFSKKNLDWLYQKYDASHGGKLNMQFELSLRDAQVAKWTGRTDAVVSEIFLGKPLSKLPASEELYKIAGEVNGLLKKFLKNLNSQIKPGVRVCLAVPAWKAPSGFVHLPALENLSDLGYNQVDFKSVTRNDLIYFRPDQIVARQLIILEKK